MVEPCEGQAGGGGREDMEGSGASPMAGVLPEGAGAETGESSHTAVDTVENLVHRTGIPIRKNSGSEVEGKYLHREATTQNTATGKLLQKNL